MPWTRYKTRRNVYFTVLLDTGSTDLWINAQGRNVALTNTTDVVASEVYGQGAVQGNIAFAELKVGNYVVPSQAFVNATRIVNMTVPVDGYMGMAFDVSNIFSAVAKAWGNETAQTLGRSFITNLFAQNTSLPNNFDLQLGRTEQMDEDGQGTFIVSGHSAAFSDVADAPKLPRVGSDRWAVVLDEMRINGEAFSFNKSSVPGVPEGKVAAVLDSGFSLPPLPPAAVDAIYKSVPGAVFSQTAGAYVIPCNSSTMLSFVFGGQEFLIHPLDLALPFAIPIVKNGATTNVTICLATYQYLNLDPTQFAGFDLILGDAFLRNVYASWVFTPSSAVIHSSNRFLLLRFDYGDFNPMTNTSGTPFIQMVTTVDPHTAMDEFYQDRTTVLATLPPTIEPSQFIQYPIATGSNSTSSSGSQDDAISGALSTDDDAGNTRSSSDKTSWIVAFVLLGANLLVGLALLVVTLTMCVRGTKGKSVGSRYVPVRFKEAESAEHDSEHTVPRYTDEA
ncbi:Vacuolar aspartic protease [Trametes pubescens]|uniref:Vacuolar aspartic protease n=1 Tax=Trametes pubescens TaxID=154538 RepID=A0A1M2VBN7_TRAPU|nr:Vacuolar aspartic protease [Trametes pubescens]